MPLTRAQAYEASDDVGRSPTELPTLGDVIAARFGRRDLLKGALGVTAIMTLPGIAAAQAERPAAPSATPESGTPAAGAGAPASRFAFPEVPAGVDDRHHVAEGYDADVLIRWGDPVLPGAPPFDPMTQTAAAQRLQFGYNNDYLGYIPMPGAANPARHGLLVVNHEYTNEELMFPGLGRQDLRSVGFAGMTRELVDIEMAAHGGTVLEIRRGDDGKWRVVDGSRHARRIDATTPIDVFGPAAGHPRLRTSADPSGRRVLGTINNCAGGITPWGTWLTCEENFHGYFGGTLPEGHPEAKSHARVGVPGNWVGWARFHERFDVGREPNEANRFGWVVEIDPFDPTSTPKKRTALGRFKHEGAFVQVNRDGRVVVYTGDDEVFERVYRFVTARPYVPGDAAANRDLLDEGTLSVARYNADGSVDWLPLVHGEGPLTAANGFASQADVVIEARRAADLLGATRMDRPEDVEVDPRTGKVYVMLTNNTKRKPDETDAANPRGANPFGHIIEMTPPDGDHAAARFTWDILVRCGDPAIAAVGATFHPATSRDGWFGMPDNCAVDHIGRLWIATDGNSARRTGRTDGVWGLETEGPLRGAAKLFYRCPVGAEMCGPVFGPDDETLFVAVQHPGESDESDPNAPPATFEAPATRWPDFSPTMPPRPSVVAITRRGGGKIGT
ncbi:PhoX family protein [Rhodoplanes azumiensis]|uniref:PhoX family protein n=1 Tax=Rhodoplanes azumiensis TaxID=1897628 RepID=A0ABW5AKU0_9BRAD